MIVPDKLPDDIAELKAIIRAQQDQNARLEALVTSFKKALFGSKSEKIDPAQYELELEDIETAIAHVEAEIDADERTAPVRPSKPRQTKRGEVLFMLDEFANMGKLSGLAESLTALPGQRELRARPLPDDKTL